MANYNLFNLYKKILNSTFRESQRRNLLNALKQFFPTEPATILDIGTGNGEFARMIQQEVPHLSISGVDVIDRGTPLIPITLYNGERLPFDDAHFDYAMIINMLHHTAKPKEVLKEALRVSRKGVIIKDHYADNALDYYTLLAMEHLNANARQLMSMPLHFYSSKEWNELFDSLNLVCEKQTSKFISYGRLWDILFGRNMHFIGRYYLSTEQRASIAQHST